MSTLTPDSPASGSSPPDISVVIPTFRRPNELAEAIASVLANKGVTAEVIVVDDCPQTSAAASVAAFRGANVRYVANPQPTGGIPSIVRNMGWPLATGRFVHFLDDDDIVPPGHYARAVAAFTARPDVGVAFGRIEPFGSDPDALQRERDYFHRGRKRAELASRLGAKLGYAASLTFSHTFLVCSSALLRRECLAPLGGFDVNVKLVEDVDFFARAIRRFGAVMLADPSIQYRIGPSLMHNDTKKDDVLAKSYRVMHDRYRAEWGALDFACLKTLSAALRMLPC